MKPQFYWECRGEDLEYEPHKKYLVYFCGCFSPPHKGHFSVVDDVLNKGDNVKVFIHQGGDERRHGIPYHLNRGVWKKYIDELLPSDRVTLQEQVSLKQLCLHPYTEEADTIVIIRGDETDGNIARAEAKASYWFRKCIRHLRDRGKEVVFVYPERPLKNVLSATKFSSALIRLRSCRSWSKKYDKLKHFFPDHLDERTAKRIIDKLQDCDLR